MLTRYYMNLLEKVKEQMGKRKKLYKEELIDILKTINID
jgi:hypothetical protein